MSGLTPLEDVMETLDIELPEEDSDTYDTDVYKRQRISLNTSSPVKRKEARVLRIWVLFMAG